MSLKAVDPLIFWLITFSLRQHDMSDFVEHVVSSRNLWTDSGNEK